MVKWIKNTKAFTLIEVMICVVIMAIMLAIAIPNFISYFDKLKNNRIVKEQLYKQLNNQKHNESDHQGVY